MVRQHEVPSGAFFAVGSPTCGSGGRGGAPPMSNFPKVRPTALMLKVVGGGNVSQVGIEVPNDEAAIVWPSPHFNVDGLADAVCLIGYGFVDITSGVAIQVETQEINSTRGNDSVKAKPA